LASLLDPYIPLIAYLLVWAGIFLLALFLKAEKHGIIAKPYYLMLKTVHFNSWMERLGNRWRRGWLTFFNIGAAMGIGLLILAIYVLSNSLFQLIIRSPTASPTVLIVPIPFLAIRWEIYPYILIAIAAVLIPHEVAHGITSVLDKVPIKSSGVFLAVVLPGGFVEIDEEDLAKRKSRTKLRVFAAGSFTNIVSAVLVILLIGSMFQMVSSGVLVTNVAAGGPAEAGGIPQWSVITQVNDAAITEPTNLTRILIRVSPGDYLTIEVNNSQNYTVQTLPHPQNSTRAYLGINSSPYIASNIPFLLPPWSFHVFNTFQWMIIILLGVGLVNMLPLFPFDGDRYFDTILSRLGLKNTKPARIIATLVSLSLLVLNLAFSYSVFGTVLLR
jgi:membrane-associated protease RseP (regulator of RpoE activity)